VYATAECNKEANTLHIKLLSSSTRERAISKNLAYYVGDKIWKLSGDTPCTIMEKKRPHVREDVT